jgi:hypothetical protein
MKVKFAFWVLFIVYYLNWNIPVFASTLTLQSDKTSLLSNIEELSVKTSIQIDVDDDKKYYLRGVFFKPDSTNYCGYTWNGASWFSGPYSTNEGWVQFFPITIKSSSWSGEIKAKIDPSDSGCRESGDYHFKIQRFTESGSASFDSQKELVVNVIIPTVTPTVMPTLFLTNTILPTASLIPSKIPISLKISTITSTPIQKITQNISNTTSIINKSVSLINNSGDDASNSSDYLISSPAGVLGIQSDLSETKLDNSVNLKKKLNFKPYIISLLLVGLGLGILTFVYIYKNIIKSRGSHI